MFLCSFDSKEILNMKYLSYSNKIVVYLTFDEYDVNNIYSYFLNDELLEKGNITNYSFLDLKEDTVYRVRVLCNETVIFDKEIKALPKRKDIVVKVNDNTGKKDVTREVQKYLDSANKDNKIIFPKGTYLTGALFVHSDTEIYLEEGAIIQGTINAKDYLPKIKSRFEGYEVMAYASLINIGSLDHNKKPDTKNVLIYGEGAIYGGGPDLRKDMLLLEKNSPVQNDRFRGRLINISNASNVIIDGLHLGHSSSWNIHPVYSDHIYIHHCDIRSKDLPNGDGIDPDSVHDLDIFSNVFHVGDDCVAIKSGKNPEGNTINIPSYNISIFDCVSLGSHGCAIGSEISGGVYNVDIFNSDFSGSIFGVHIKTTLKRGGYVRNIRVKHCKVPFICIHTVPYNDDGKSAKTITEFSNFDFEDIVITGKSNGPDGRTYDYPHILVEGFKDYPNFHDIKFNDIKLNGEERISVNNALNVSISNINNYKED